MKRVTCLLPLGEFSQEANCATLYKAVEFLLSYAHLGASIVLSPPPVSLHSQRQWVEESLRELAGNAAADMCRATHAKSNVTGNPREDLDALVRAYENFHLNRPMNLPSRLLAALEQATFLKAAAVAPEYL
jgi:hypothetical protein